MLLENHNAIEVGGYAISNSLRFQSASSQYLSRTPASTTNQQKFTISFWTKYSTGSSDRNIVSFGNSTTFQIYFGVSGTNLSVGTQILGVSNPWILSTTQVFRDPSAWYHIVVAVDTTQATASNRCLVYVNGSQVTSFATSNYPTLNYNTGANTNTAHSIGRREDNAQYYDGYLTEVNFIDGQALTPSSFGETDATTGQWIAKKYTGTYGTNGFYLPFSNGTSTTTLGADSSGNGNNWTLNNFTRSAGVSDCWMIDVPSGNGGASGTQPSSNYCVLNPLDTSIFANSTISNANLRSTNAAGGNRAVKSTMQFSAGKFYWEMTLGSVPTANGLTSSISYAGTYSNYNAFNGQIYINGSLLGTYATSTTNDVIGVAVDRDANTISFYKNNVLLATGTGLTSGEILPYFFTGSGSTTEIFNVNFGQRSFQYTPPTGFKALCTANLPASTIVKGNQYMDATLWTGDGTSSKTITNAAGFSPDFVWIKNRSRDGADPYYGVHMLFNTIAGAGNRLMSQSTASEVYSASSLTSFNSNGFSVGSDLPVNRSGDSFVGWQWDAGSSTVTNTNGSISSQVRANPTAGVSVVTRTGTGVAGTIGHGLGVAPKMIINKSRSNGAYNWSVYHASLTNANYVIYLDATNAQGSEPTAWNGTAPTSSVFSVGTSAQTNLNTATYVSYCFSEIAGFSKFTSYTGNGSADGPFVYLGFRPKYLMIKNTTTSGFGGWLILDTSRNPYNIANAGLAADISNAEFTVAYADMLSNGFKIKIVDNGVNASSNNYIVAAFAESPFASSNAR